MEEKQRQKPEKEESYLNSRPEKPAFKDYLKLVGWTVLAMALIFIFQLIGQGIIAIWGKTQGLSLEESMIVFQDYTLIVVFISDILAFLSIWKLLKGKQVDPLKAGGFRKKLSWKRVIIASLTASFGFTASKLLVFLMPVNFYNNAQEFSQSFGQMSNVSPWISLIILFLSLCVIGPATEELAFRGLPVYLGKKKGIKPWVAIVIGAIVFGLAHWMAGGFGLVISASLLGILFGFIYLNSGSLKVNMIAHGVVNLPAFIVLAFFPDQMAGTVPEASINQIGTLIIPIILFTLLTFFGIRWLFKHPAENFSS